jgi:putative PIG3 family NAD(P)H quinone oxidoreductase
MSAVAPAAAGPPDVLRVYDRHVPEPDANQVLIRVDWAGVNPHDCNQRRRGVPPSGETDVLGLEVSGTVVAVGAAIDSGRTGQAVCALVSGGGYAEYAVTDSDLAIPYPVLIDARQAAALPEALFTAWLNLIELGRLAAGDWVLIHGGTGNIGSAATQIADVMGASVITTVGGPEKQAVSLGLGASHVIDYRAEPLSERVLALTSGRGVDVVLDGTGLYAEANLRCLAPDGRILHISSGSGSFSPPLGLIMQKRATLTGAQLRPLPLARKRRIAGELRHKIWPHLGTRIKPLMDRAFALGDAAQAHVHVESRAGIGKTVLRCGRHVQPSNENA